MPGRSDKKYIFILCHVCFTNLICARRLYSSPAVTVPYIDNEPLLQFAPGSAERAAVEKV